jgi:hypothetical protein
MTTRLLGRMPRGYAPTIHLSSLLATKPLPTPSASVDHLSSMPQFPNHYNMYKNDVLGCCVVASMYHSNQVFDWNASGKAIIDPDADIISVYEAISGYDPKNPATDRGCVTQDAMEYWMKTGIPTGQAKNPLNKIIGFVEVNPRNLQMVKISIEEFCLVSIGFSVPANVLPENADPPALWQVEPHQADRGGHEVVVAAYNQKIFGLISWGQYYRMTNQFFQKYTDECYALISPDWITATGKTPCGYTLDQLKALMHQL